MTGLIARVTAIATVALAVFAVVALYVTSRPDVLRGGAEARAAFEDAYPLLEGMHVRVDGAVAGTVKDIELGEDGNAHITMQLFEGSRPPRSDAVAAIRQEDITGDSYVSLSLGAAETLLANSEIPTSRTLSAPRFDDLLNAFSEPVRRGLELTFVELGRALEGRGEALNQAALELRPGLEAANQALAEVNSQNAALVDLVEDAEKVNAQAADRSGELGALVSGLAATLRETSEHLPALDAAFDRAPETVARSRVTLAKLEATANAATPFARTLNEAAPRFAETAQLLGPFLDDASVVFDDVAPTLDLVTKLLRASEPTLKTDPKRVFTAPFDLTAGIGAVLNTLIGDPALVESLFGAGCYGGRICDSSQDKGLGAIAVEDGDLIGYPTNDPDRWFIRAAAVGSCETFGVPIEPGCFTELPEFIQNLLGSLPGFPALPLRRRARTAGAGEGDSAGPGAAPDTGTTAPGTQPLDGLDDLPKVPDVGPAPGKGLDDTLDDVLGGLGLGGKGKDAGKGKGGKGPGGPVQDLLDFLLGP